MGITIHYPCSVSIDSVDKCPPLQYTKPRNAMLFLRFQQERISVFSPSAFPECIQSLIMRIRLRSFVFEHFHSRNNSIVLSSVSLTEINHLSICQLRSYLWSYIVLCVSRFGFTAQFYRNFMMNKNKSNFPSPKQNFIVLNTVKLYSLIWLISPSAISRTTCVTLFLTMLAMFKTSLEFVFRNAL